MIKFINKISLTYSHWLYIVMAALICPVPILNIIPFSLFFWRGTKKLLKPTVSLISGYEKVFGLTVPIYEEIVPNKNYKIQKILLALSYLALAGLCVFTTVSTWPLDMANESEKYELILTRSNYGVFTLIAVWAVFAIVNHISYLVGKNASKDEETIEDSTSKGNQPKDTIVTGYSNPSNVTSSDCKTSLQISSSQPFRKEDAVLVEVDPFLNEKVVHGYYHPERNPYKVVGFRIDHLFANLEYKQQKHSLILIYQRGNISFDKSKTLQLLLNNKSIINLSEHTSSVKYPQNSNYMFAVCPIQELDIEKIAQSGISRYRILNSEGIEEFISEECDVLHLFMQFCEQYLHIVKSTFPNRVVGEENVVESESVSENSCYVYLMEDKANGYHKIGFPTNHVIESILSKAKNRQSNL